MLALGRTKGTQKVGRRLPTPVLEILDAHLYLLIIQLCLYNIVQLCYNFFEKNIGVPLSSQKACEKHQGTMF